jgi:AmmeMemoRadiSam system protein B
MKRQPAVAGQFYSATPQGLSQEVQQYCEVLQQKVKAIGMVAPHAGLMYSGKVAGALYSQIKFPDTFILLGPNHTGMGKPASIMTSGEWVIPSGRLTIDSSLAKEIRDKTDVVMEDSTAHMMEHSLEVQLPFIYHFSPHVKIVPITLMTGSLDFCKTIGEILADTIKQAEYPVSIVASSDMSHYETDSSARVKDKKAIDEILSLNPEGLYETVIKESISMCGFIPATVMLYAVQKLGAEEAVLVKYMTSGDVSGDYDHVVGYAGILIR